MAELTASCRKYRIFCLSGWGKVPNGIYFPQLLAHLATHGHTVIPATEPASNGDVQRHVANLADLVDRHGGVGPDCVFIGQSIGSQIIMRFLSSRPAATFSVRAWVSVGGWLRLARPFKGTEPWCDFSTVDTERLRAICPTVRVLISSDDAIVGLGAEEHEASWRSGVPWARLRIASDRGHYIVPSLLEDELRFIMDAIDGDGSDTGTATVAAAPAAEAETETGTSDGKL